MGEDAVDVSTEELDREDVPAGEGAGESPESDATEEGVGKREKREEMRVVGTIPRLEGGDLSIADVRFLPYPEEAQIARVSFQMGGKFNLGNYESADMSLHVSIPCLPEEVKAVAEWIEAFVENVLERHVGEIRATIAGKTKGKK